MLDTVELFRKTQAGFDVTIRAMLSSVKERSMENQRRMERRSTGAVFEDRPSDRRRQGLDRRGMHRSQITPGVIRPPAGSQLPWERRSCPDSGME